MWQPTHKDAEEEADLEEQRLELPRGAVRELGGGEDARVERLRKLRQVRLHPLPQMQHVEARPRRTALDDGDTDA